MNEALTKKLLDDFPRLYRNRDKTSMQYGFACGDGWFDLIYKLSQDIEAVARESGLSPDSTKWPLCRQVKEKLGSLRFVVFTVDGLAGVNERIGELRLAALNRSLQICEQCGQQGELVNEGCIARMVHIACEKNLCAPSSQKDERLVSRIETGSLEQPRRIM